MRKFLFAWLFAATLFSSSAFSADLVVDWVNPETRVDGTALEIKESYAILYNIGTGEVFEQTVPHPASEATFLEVPPGKYGASVVAYDNEGRASEAAILETPFTLNAAPGLPSEVKILFRKETQSDITTRTIEYFQTEGQ